MRKILAVTLTLLFAWNAILGGMDALVLCLHGHGDAHVELFGKEPCGEHSNCAGDPVAMGAADCSPCTDFVLGSADLGPSRPNETEQLTAPDLHVRAWTPLLPVLHSAPHPVPAHLTRGPPRVEPAAALISRCIVLRL